MTLQIGSLNVLAILVSFVSYMILGALWYSPLLFGNIWLKLVGKKAEDIDKEDANRSMMLSMVPAALSVFSLALLTAFLKTTTIIDALIVGSLVSVGFIGMSSLNLVFFEDRSFKLVLLNVGYPFVAFNVASVILTLWK